MLVEGIDVVDEGWEKVAITATPQIILIITPTVFFIWENRDGASLLPKLIIVNTIDRIKQPNTHGDGVGRVPGMQT